MTAGHPPVVVTGYRGRDGLADRFDGAAAGVRVEIRTLATEIVPDAAERLDDAYAFLGAFPHPFVPRPLGVHRVPGAVAFVCASADGPVLGDLTAEPLGEPLAVCVLSTVADYLALVRRHRSRSTRVDLQLRSLSTRSLRMRPSGPTWMHVETLAGRWPARTTRTTWLAGVTDLPFDGEETIQDDVRDLAMVMVEVLGGRKRGDALARALLSAVNPHAYGRAVRAHLQSVDARPELVAALEGMLAWYPDERPTPEALLAGPFAHHDPAPAARLHALHARATPQHLPHPLVGTTLGGAPVPAGRSLTGRAPEPSAPAPRSSAPRPMAPTSFVSTMPEAVPAPTPEPVAVVSAPEAVVPSGGTVWRYGLSCGALLLLAVVLAALGLLAIIVAAAATMR